MTGLLDTRRILCVLSDEQTADYRDELIAAGGPGVQFVFDADADNALERIPSLSPTVIVVGMTLEAMDGLEFIAYLMRQHPNFSKRVIALPERGDPFPAVLHRRDPATGRSTTEELEAGEVAEVIRSLVDQRAQDSEPTPLQGELSQEEMKSWESAVDSARQPSSHAGLPILGAQATGAGHAEGSASELPSLTGPARWKLLAGVGGGLLLLLVVGVALMGGDDDPSPAAAPTDGNSAPSPAKSAPPPAPDPETVPSPTPEPEPDPDDTGDPTEIDEGDDDSGEPPPPDAVGDDLRGLTTLPFLFRKGQADFEVTDEMELERLVGAAAQALAASPSARLEIGGHTSREGNRRHNRKLGRRRATRTRDRLVELGLPADRLDVKSYGSRRPQRDTGTRSYQNDRRTTIRLVE